MLRSGKDCSMESGTFSNSKVHPLSILEISGVRSCVGLYCVPTKCVALLFFPVTKKSVFKNGVKTHTSYLTVDGVHLCFCKLYSSSEVVRS